MPDVAVDWHSVELRAYPCDFCGSGQFEIALTKRGVLTQHTFNIVRCAGCGHVRVSPRIPDELIPALYDDAYYRGEGFDRTVNYSEEAQRDYRSSRIVRAICATVSQCFAPVTAVKALDIGCGLGDMVLGMRDCGFDAAGSDSSPMAGEVLRRRGVPTLDDLETNPERYDGYFDLITCVEVIEHVTEPTEFLHYLSRLVRPGGFIFFLTGNWNIQRRISGTPYIMPEGHIQYFTPKSLERFIRKAGLQPYQVPVNYAWYASRYLPEKTPKPILRMLCAAAVRLAPEYGPFPLARRPA
jgi:2-polyprenyl-3-methyl-5-hydroxy-6-metoxy-1,4-benzoquinol methylase